MLYPISLLLWAILSSSPANTTCESVSFPGETASRQVLRPALSDSSIFHDLKKSLEAYQQAAPPEKLYLHLDRTLLKPGETVWFNAFLVNAGDLLPSVQSQMFQVDLLDGRGSVIQSKKYLALNGTAAGDFDFPASLPGGQYKLKAYTNWMLNFQAYFERDITLQKVVLPRVNLKLEFERKGLGARDMATARFDAQSLDNQPISNKNISFSATLGGQVIQSGEVRTDAAGRAYVRFQLPEKVTTTDGLLLIQVEHNGQMESISRPIPITLNKIDLQFFPEGGDAVAGLPCRMAFKAVNEFGKPVDVAGGIFNLKGEQVATFDSYHNGMGAFEFVPQAQEQYEARVTRPFVADKPFPITTPLDQGYTLRLQEKGAEDLTFQVAGNTYGNVVLVGQCQDKLIFFKALSPRIGVPELVKIPTKNLPTGIVRFTLFNQNKSELAERLVFVNRDRGLKIELKPDKQQYLPREKIKLKIQVSDHAGKPVPGRFSLAVTDEALLTYADDKQGHLLSSLLLEQDVKGVIEEPNFYFDTREPKSEPALDYLLMTQGWRRFTWQMMLSNQSVNCPYEAERAEIAGIYLQNNGSPASKITMQLYPNGPKTITDKNGHFSFQQVNLDQYSHLKGPDNAYYELLSYQNQLIRRANGTLQTGKILAHVPSPDGRCYLTGIVEDHELPLPGATVKVLNDNGFVRGAITNLDGVYNLALEPGVYDLEISYIGYQTQKIPNIQVLARNNHYQNVVMSNSVLTEVVITRYKVPLIEQDKMAGGQTLTSDQIRSLSTRKVNAITATTAGTVALDGGDINIKGSRSNATNYYIDGIRVTGSAPPVQDIEQFTDLDFEGVPADEDGSALEEVSIIAIRDDMIRADDFSTGRTFKKDQLVPRRKALRTYEKPTQSAPYTTRRTPIFARNRVFYSPQYTTAQKTINRTDFRSTIYWNPNIETNKRGEASVEFYTSDAITNFRATLEGVSSTGQPGRCQQQFFAQKPVSIAVKVPASVITGDVLNLQVAVTNNTPFPTGGSLQIRVPEHFQALNASQSSGAESISVGAGETKIISLPYRIGFQTQEDRTVSIQLAADEMIVDAFETSIRTLFTGYPVKQVAGGLGAQTTFNLQLNHPVEGTVNATLTAYPSPLEDLLKGMERMLQQPSGCFEQVSSSNYPNLLVLDLLRQLGDQRPEIESRASTLLEDGYKKLMAYECKSGGFDWWGRDPGHEGLTAYGILEFTDMARVFPVDKAMIARTVKWMSSRRNGQGGWTLNPNSLHGWQNDPVLDCYIVWALAEAGYGKEFTPEVTAAQAQALTSKDPYQLALLANALLAMKNPAGDELVKQLLEKQDENGSWIGATHSVMHAYGECFRIETTALAALALMKSGKKTARLQKAIDFLIRSKTGYGYGSTQSTVMALKAIIEFVKLDRQTSKEGTFTVMIDGKNAGDFTFSTKGTDKVEFKHLERFFTSDHPTVEVVFADKATVIPFDLELQYASSLPQNAPDCPLSFRTILDKTTAAIGETVRITASIRNTTGQVQGSPMIVLGIPSGLTLQPWQLKKLVEEKKCDFYELWDGFAVFHFEQLAAGASRELTLDLRADIAGTFEAPASQAFLYYSNDQRVWSKPEKLEIR